MLAPRQLAFREGQRVPRSGRLGQRGASGDGTSHPWSRPGKGDPASLNHHDISPPEQLEGLMSEASNLVALPCYTMTFVMVLSQPASIEPELTLAAVIPG